MAYKKGDDLFYVTSVGVIREAVAASDERNGAVFICGKNNEDIGEMGTMHLCKTARAAEIMSANRRPNYN